MHQVLDITFPFGLVAVALLWKAHHEGTCSAFRDGLLGAICGQVAQLPSSSSRSSTMGQGTQVIVVCGNFAKIQTAARLCQGFSPLILVICLALRGGSAWHSPQLRCNE
eukprot:4675337-Amphidinium_carterae.1